MSASAAATCLTFVFCSTCFSTAFLPLPFGSACVAFIVVMGLVVGSTVSAFLSMHVHCMYFF